jgi:uncharacterized protein (TIGR00661 family)
MSGGNFNILAKKQRILVAPLEWGLGHATRCIPVITELISLDCEVFIAAEGAVKVLLEKEFPLLTFLPLKGYRMQYSRKGYWLPWKIFLQFPKIIVSVFTEHRWLRKTIKEFEITAVISDNRFGLYDLSLPCIYMTHQLTIKTGNRFTKWFAQKIHYHFINKYQECWVPDMVGEINLAGSLSHPKCLPKVPVRYIGPLSRFEKVTVEKKYDLTIIISGPEPQRTVFEELLLNQLGNYEGKALFVRGLPNNLTPIAFGNTRIEIQNHLSAAKLNKAIQQSSMIISRSGYTTVMDLVKLQKEAILIPTPGQTEQAYLAEFLMQEKIFYCIEQSDFLLNGALKEAENFSYTTLSFDPDEYKKTIKRFIDSLIKIRGGDQ